MTFCYRFQDRSGAQKEGEVRASSLDAAYSVLRKSGIRPMKVWAKPGMLNRLTVGKRWTAIAVLVVLSAILFYDKIALRREMETRADLPPDLGRLVAARHQVGDCSCAFNFPAEEVLSLFARPGELPAGGLDETVLMPMFLGTISAALSKSLRADGNDTTAAVDLKAVVEGLKNEVRTARASGHAPDGFLRYLIARQEMEAAHRQSMLANLKKADEKDREALRQKYNEGLSAMGIREIAKEEMVSVKSEKDEKMKKMKKMKNAIDN